MSVRHCDKCGGRITFRKVNGRTVPIHLSGGCTARTSDSSNQKSFFGSTQHYQNFVNPNANCPVCGASVFYYENTQGSKVFFDELGPPWPLHPCTSDKSNLNMKGGNDSTRDINFKSKGWYPFDLQVYKIKKKGAIALIVGFLLKENGEKKISFKIRHSNTNKAKVNNALLFVKKYQKKNHSPIFKLSGFNPENHTVFSLESVKKFSAGRGQKVERNRNKDNYGSHKISDRWVTNSLKPIEDDDEKIILCPLCEHRIANEAIDKHLKEQHWDKYQTENRGYDKIAHSIGDKFNFDTWKKLVLNIEG